MKCDKKFMRLYAVTDRAWVGKQSLYEQVESALKGGATCVQLREKHMSDDDFLKEALEIGALCKRYNVPFFINDNVSVAIKCKADGIHVGQDDMAVEQVRALVGDDMMIGVSAPTVEEAVRAVKGVLPKATLRYICAAVDVPVVAIGGINKSNIMQLAGTGVDGAALVSAIFAADDIEGECRALRKLSDEMVNA